MRRIKETIGAAKILCPKGATNIFSLKMDKNTQLKLYAFEKVCKASRIVGRR